MASPLPSEIGLWLQGIAAPSSSKLLPDLLPQEKGTFTLVLDLNETLVYSDWKVNIVLILCSSGRLLLIV